MATLTPRGQRGITLIEIVLWCAIVAAAVVAVFVFGKKASVTAAVETEQRQVEDIVKTVDSIFATQPNFAALGTNGAVYLRERAARSGLKFQTNDAGDPILATGLGSGSLTLSSWDAVPPSGPAVPNSGYRLAYQGLAPSECSKLVTATYPVAYQVSAGQDDLNDSSATNLATRGQMTVSPTVIAENCAAGDGNATVFLYFYPARAIAGATTPTPLPAARCAPVHERQNVACPAGQTGTVTQERDGTCTGPGNTMVYTVWTTTTDTCQAAPTTPATVTPPTAPDMCTIVSFTNVVACSAGQTGQIIQTRSLDTCAGTYTPWTTTSTMCQNAAGPATCTPSSDTQTLGCAPGETGSIQQSRTSSCSSPTATPTWSAWETVSATCRGSSTCQPQRETGPVPCASGQYGAWSGERERFRRCTNATTQAPGWDAWSVVTPNYGCTSCPPNITDTTTQWVTQSTPCPVGQVGSYTWEEEQVSSRTTSYSCPAGTTALPSPSVSPWGAWVNTGATRNVFNTCAPATCSGNANESQWLGTSGTCPVGQSGSYTWEYERSRSRTCNAGTWTAWGGWTSTGATRNVVNTCAPSATCVAPAPEWRELPYKAACPAGMTGTGSNWKTGEQRTWSCPSPTGSPVASAWVWDGTGGVFVDNGDCTTTTCSGPSSESQWPSTSGTCPVGQTGTYTWEYEQTRTRTCNAGTWSTWGGWTTTGATRNVVNTCAPSGPSGRCTVGMWWSFSGSPFGAGYVTGLFDPTTCSTGPVASMQLIMWDGAVVFVDDIPASDPYAVQLLSACGAAVSPAPVVVGDALCGH